MENTNLICDICDYEYDRRNYIPLKLTPCGHNLCKKCVIDWFVINKKKTCPFCRTIVTNNIVADDILCKLKLNFNCGRTNEIVKDYSNVAIYVINNNMKDINDASKIKEIRLCSRWEAAVYNLIEVARYNIERGIYALYYILHPTQINYWEVNKDFIIIDPLASNKMDNLYILKGILSTFNIRRLHTFNNISSHIGQYLKYIIPEKKNIAISYNLITDDIPSVSKLFEKSLVDLSSNYRLFISVMLYTTNPTVSIYYSSLYNRLSGSILYVDIVRDCYIDALLFYQSQRKIISYSKKLHIGRMAGCYFPHIYGCTSLKLTSTNLCILIKNLLGIAEHTTFILPRDHRSFINLVNNKNYYISDVITNKNCFIINTRLLSNKISRIQYRHSIRTVLRGSHYNSVKSI